MDSWPRWLPAILAAVAAAAVAIRWWRARGGDGASSDSLADPWTVASLMLVAVAWPWLLQWWARGLVVLALAAAIAGRIGARRSARARTTSEG